MTENQDGQRKRGAGGRPRVPGITDAILEATIMLAAEGGLDDLTLDAIATRAGVGRPTIYRRWQSKEALLNEAMAKIVDMYFELPQTGNIRDDLVEYTKGIISAVQGPLRDYYAAYFNVEKADLGADAIERSQHNNFGIVRRAIERGDLRPDTNPQLLLELIFGVIWYRATATSRVMDDAFAETVVDAVLNAWLVQPSSRRESKGRQAARRDGQRSDGAASARR